MSQRIEGRPKGGHPVVAGAGVIALDIVVDRDGDKALRWWAGGTCANVLSILSMFGWRSYPIATLNGDSASTRIRSDFERWGVRLDFAELQPGRDAPIVIQRLRQGADGQIVHRFEGRWLHRALPLDVADAVHLNLKSVDVFFFDRTSPGALRLAELYRSEGTLVVFEPSTVSSPAQFKQALALADVIKYSLERKARFAHLLSRRSPLLEIETQAVRGLRYRARFLSNARWRHLPALPADGFRDSAGAGDWCTASILNSIGATGRSGVESLGDRELETALLAAQAWARWNCGFDGARGSMYSGGRRRLVSELRALEKSVSPEPAQV